MTIMTVRTFVLATALLALAPGGCATTTATHAADLADAVHAHRAWWNAYMLGNVAELERSTASDAIGTFSSGTTLDRVALMRSAAGNGASRGFEMTWSGQTVQSPGAGLANVVATSTERVGSSLQHFRISTLLRRAPESGWEVVALQSTRIAAASAPVAESVSGPLGDFVGNYRTPKGRFLRMEVEAGALRMLEPDGKPIDLVAIGPAMFESAARSPINGFLRFVFSRDAAGRVAGLSRITEGRVDTYPRVDGGE